MRNLGLAYMLASLLLCTDAAAAPPDEAVCGKLANSFERNTMNSVSSLRSRAAQQWNQCETMARMSKDTKQLSTTRQRIVSGGGRVSVIGLFGANANFSDSDFANDESFRLALMRESRSACGGASSLEELERTMNARGVEYFDTFQYIEGCLRALREQPIVFSPPDPEAAVATFAVGIKDVNSINVDIEFRKDLIECTGYGQRAFGSEKFCEGRPEKERDDCRMHRFTIRTPATQIQASCVAKVPDTAGLAVTVFFNGRSLTVPVPIRHSPAGLRAIAERDEARTELALALQQREAEIRAIKANVEADRRDIATLQESLKNLTAQLASMDQTLANKIQATNQRVDATIPKGAALRLRSVRFPQTCLDVRDQDRDEIQVIRCSPNDHQRFYLE